MNYHVEPLKHLRNVLDQVYGERLRQMSKGYGVAHDASHVNEEIAALAAFFAMPEGMRDWPATETGYGATLGEAAIPHGWTPPDLSDHTRVDQLVKAAACCIAEIVRIERAEALTGSA